MIGVSLDAKDLMRVLKSTAEYTDSFLKEVKRLEPQLTQQVADMSIDVFYEYLDGLARSHPGMLHHVYEWGQVGDPMGRLFELTKNLGRNTARISVDFLQSDSVSDSSNTPFYDKARIMEEGIPLIIQEKTAQALFFEIDGQEFFRKGPIYIANPGGEGTRGSFLNAFNDFYLNYFNDVYLRSIRFYEHFENPKDFSKNFRTAVKSQGGASMHGRKSALSWINSSTGDKL